MGPEELEQLENNFTDYYEIDKWTSREAFEIMSEFADQVSDNNLQSRLFDALRKNKPFREFKFVIDNSDDFRQQWFDFKNNGSRTWYQVKPTKTNRQMKKMAAPNTWVLRQAGTCKLGALCFVSSVVLVDSFVLETRPNAKPENVVSKYYEITPMAWLFSLAESKPP
ncbi:MAG: UPF0158 family protein [Chitinophagales bacterium]